MKNVVDSRQLMSDAKFYEAYSRFDEAKGRFETFEEAVSRVMDMHRTKYKDKMTPELEAFIQEAQEAYTSQLVLGAQRALQFGGEQILKNNLKMYNCTSSHANRPAFFGEYMELLLSGCGVGFSVQKHHIGQLPALKAHHRKPKLFEIPDSIEGWAESFDVLFSSYFESGAKHEEFSGCPVHFDFSQIRPKGAFISGGFKAPGPEPLRKALVLVDEILSKVAKENRQMRAIEVYDACMHMADAVISGGVRRSATICLFSFDDEEMIKAKTGDWYVTNPQRARSNNSVVLLRKQTSFETFQKIMESVQHSGEPGFIWTDSLEWTFNPCVEVGMLPFTKKGYAQYLEHGKADPNETGFQGCNLTEINGAQCITVELFYKACRAAAILGTLQAGYTDFPFLSKASRKIFEQEALIGVGITGWMNNPHILFDEKVMKTGAQIVLKVNKEIAKLIGIRQAARGTVVKPAGNTSTLLKSASGIHGEHSERYIRHVTMGDDSEVVDIIRRYVPEMLEQSVWSKNGTDLAIAFPVVSPPNSIFKADLMGIKQLEYVKKAQQVWIEYGTNEHLCLDKNLRHNVSNTITVDNWEEVTQYVYDNREWFCGISFMSAMGDKAFPQAPFTEVLDEQQIIQKYGAPSLFASGLITRGLDAFNNNLWTATATAMGYGEDLSVESHENMGKRDWVRMFNKFAKNHFEGDIYKTSDMLKDVYNLHKWTRIVNNIKDIPWTEELKTKKFTDVDTLGAIACNGGACEVVF